MKDYDPIKTQLSCLSNFTLLFEISYSLTPFALFIFYSKCYDRLRVKSFGCHVEMANTGEEAVKKAGQTAYDLILMDLGLPGMQGDEAARIIKENNSAAKVLALSAHDDPAHRHRADDVGIDQFLSKPLTPIKFESILAQFVGDKYQPGQEESGSHIAAPGK